VLIDAYGRVPDGLLAVFIAILRYGISMGLDVDCGCFGPDDPEAEAFRGLRAALCRDLVMMAGVGFLYGWRRRRAIRPVRIGDVYRQFFEKEENERCVHLNRG
jgi:hypothetical protein